MNFRLAWYERTGDKLEGMTDLPLVTDDLARILFDLKPDEYPGDCLDITKENCEWLVCLMPEFFFDFDRYEYFVEAYQASNT